MEDSGDEREKPVDEEDGSGRWWCDSSLSFLPVNAPVNERSRGEVDSLDRVDVVGSDAVAADARRRAVRFVRQMSCSIRPKANLRLTCQIEVPLASPKLPPHAETPRYQWHVGDVVYGELDEKARVLVVHHRRAGQCRCWPSLVDDGCHP
jgi:hypothetical protein